MFTIVSTNYVVCLLHLQSSPVSSLWISSSLLLSSSSPSPLTLIPFASWTTWVLSYYRYRYISASHTVSNSRKSIIVLKSKSQRKGILIQDPRGFWCMIHHINDVGFDVAKKRNTNTITTRSWSRILKVPDPSHWMVMLDSVLVCYTTTRLSKI